MTTENAQDEREWAAPESWARKAAVALGADAAVIILFKRPVTAEHECNFRVTGATVRSGDGEALEEWVEVLRNEMESGVLQAPDLNPETGPPKDGAPGGGQSPQGHRDAEKRKDGKSDE